MTSAALILAVLVALVPALAAASSVDANTADASALVGVSGIGPAIAGRILAARREAGPFRDLDDLRERVRGIGEANLRRMAAAGLSVGSAPSGQRSVVAGGRAVAPGGQPDQAQGAQACPAPQVEMIVGNPGSARALR